MPVSFQSVLSRALSVAGPLIATMPDLEGVIAGEVENSYLECYVRVQEEHSINAGENSFELNAEPVIIYSIAASPQSEQYNDATATRIRRVWLRDRVVTIPTTFRQPMVVVVSYARRMTGLDDPDVEETPHVVDALALYAIHRTLVSVEMRRATFASIEDALPISTQVQPGYFEKMSEVMYDRFRKARLRAGLSTAGFSEVTLI